MQIIHAGIDLCHSSAIFDLIVNIHQYRLISSIVSCHFHDPMGHANCAATNLWGNAGVGKVIPHDKLELIDDEWLGIVDRCWQFFLQFAFDCFCMSFVVGNFFDKHLHIEHFVAESSVASSCWLMTSCGPSLHRAAGQQRHEKWSARRASTTTRASSSGTNWLSWRCRSRSWTDRKEW